MSWGRNNLAPHALLSVMSWDRNNLAPHALISVLCDSLSFSSAGLNLGCHLGQLGMLPMVAGNGPNTSVISSRFF